MPESNPCFIDSGIWLYAFIADNPHKKDVTQALIKTSQPVISGLVVNEVCVNLIKRAKFPFACRRMKQNHKQPLSVPNSDTKETERKSQTGKK